MPTVTATEPTIPSALRAKSADIDRQIAEMQQQQALAAQVPPATDPVAPETEPSPSTAPQDQFASDPNAEAPQAESDGTQRNDADHPESVAYEDYDKVLQQFRSLQGRQNKLNSELERLRELTQQQAAAMLRFQQFPQSTVTPTQTPTQQQPAQPAASPSLNVADFYTKEQIEDYGEDFLKAQLEANSRFQRQLQEQLQQQLQAQLQQQLQPMQEASRQSQEAIFFSSLSNRLAAQKLDFNQLDSDPLIVEWLNQPDDAYGEKRIDIVRRLAANGDVERVAKWYERGAQEVNPALKAKPKVDLTGQVLPGSAPKPGGAGAVSQKRVYSTSQWQAAYVPIEHQARTGQPLTKAQQELKQELDAAVSEGRVRPG